MTLRRFLDAAYVLLIEEFQRVGVHYHEAADRIRELSGIEREEAVREIDVAAQNQQAMRQLMGQMPGGRMPG